MTGENTYIFVYGSGNFCWNFLENIKISLQRVLCSLENKHVQLQCTLKRRKKVQKIHEFTILRNKKSAKFSVN